MESFTFDVNAKRIKVSDQEILSGLREYGESVGRRPFTMLEFEGWKGRKFGMSVVTMRFGTWREALERAGLMGGRVREYPPAELMNKLEATWRKLGHRPGYHSLKREAGVSAAPFKRHWGTLRSACERLAAFHAGKMTREEMLRPIPADECKSKRRAIPVDVRWRVLKRDGHRCLSCGASPAIDASVQLQIDHIVPVSKGGGNEEGNLRVLCRDCNAGKGVGQ